VQHSVGAVVGVQKVDVAASSSRCSNRRAVEPACGVQRQAA